MASRLILDGARNRYDTAFLMSGDHDFVPAVRLAREELGRRVIVIQPPGRSSTKLVDVADAGLHFNRTAFAQSQLPDPVMTRKGKAIPRPESWQ